MTTHYDTLKVTCDADDVVIESAYRALMKKYHPDKTNGDLASTERAKQINAAYSTLRDPGARQRYDRTLAPTEADVAYEEERSWTPEPDLTPTSASSPTSGPTGGGWLTSLTFIALAATVAIGGVGSLMQPSTPQAAIAPTIEADTNTADVERSRSAERIDEPDSRREADTSPAVVAAPEPEENPVANCIGALTAVSYLMCADSELKDADARLDTAFSARLRDAGDADALRADQNAWYAKRDALPADRDRILQAYSDRIRILQADDLEGLY